MAAYHNPTHLPEWQALQKKALAIKPIHLKEFFEKHPNRFDDFHIQNDGLLLDYSKNKIDTEALNLLVAFAKAMNLEGAKRAFLNGARINETENRAVMHTALRYRGAQPKLIDGQDVMPSVRKVLDQMKTFSHQVRAGHHKGFTGKPIKKIVNIGIGGSDLGPKMVYEALKFLPDTIETAYLSNVDGADWAEIRKTLDPETTLFIIASKTFTTQETMSNALSAKEWFLNNGGNAAGIAQHFVAVSTHAEKVAEFGIAPENMFVFWDWVGGRYSLWSAIGLSVALAFGFDVFEELLTGAAAMDAHFEQEPLEHNMPVILALIGIWYRNFFDASSIAILPYAQNLHRFPAFLQQADMESNGKCVDKNGDPVDYATGPIVWGEPGTNGQHAFYQLLHQGTLMIPADFIAIAKNHHPDLTAHHQKLWANFLAQTQALMLGKTVQEARLLLENSGKSQAEIEKLLPYKVFKGDNPTNSIVLKEMSPKNLGQLIALYEHKIFVQGVLWNVFSFDQWGVELGKELANKLLPVITGGELPANTDSSTQGLLLFLKS